MPQIVILAGPNGAGKSTCAARYVPRSIPFINADNIAREMNLPLGRSADLAAGRVLIAQMEELERQQTSFALETNLANHTLAKRIPQWREAGYEVALFFVWIPSDDMAVRRVAQRVLSGGHDILEATIRRRYRVGLRLFFQVYQSLVSRWRLYDNSSLSGPLLVAQSVRLPQSEKRTGLRVKRRMLWESILQDLGKTNE